MSDAEITRSVRSLIETVDGPRRVDLSLAKALGISRSSAVDRLTGRARWKASEVRELAEHYGVPASSLIEGQKPAPPQKRRKSSGFPVLGGLSSSKKASGKKASQRTGLPADTRGYEVEDTSLSPLLMPGDIVLVSEREDAGDGDLVVAENDGRRIFGRLSFDGSNVVVRGPRERRKPLTAHRSDVELYKVVGVRFC